MKNYLKEIFRLRKEFSKEERRTIKKAYQFAKKSHKGQKFDGQNYPYFIHPAYAGFLLAKWGIDYEVICAGILHDTVEDCGVQLLPIKKMFGERVAFLVDGMSWEIKWSFENKRYEKDWDGFFKKICKYSTEDTAVILLHCADERSKLEDIFGKKFEKKDEPLEKTKKRFERYLAFYVPLYDTVGLKKHSKYLHNKLYSVVKKKVSSKLSRYIAKGNIKKIKRKLNAIKEIGELK